LEFERPIVVVERPIFRRKRSAAPDERFEHREHFGRPFVEPFFRPYYAPFYNPYGSFARPYEFGGPFRGPFRGHFRGKRSFFMPEMPTFPEDGMDNDIFGRVQALFPIKHVPEDKFMTKDHDEKDQEVEKKRKPHKPMKDEETKSMSKPDKKHQKPSEMGAADAYYVPDYSGPDHQDYKPAEHTYQHTEEYKPESTYQHTEYKPETTYEHNDGYNTQYGSTHRVPRPTPSPSIPAYGHLGQVKLIKPQMDACLNRPIHDRHGGQNYYFSWRDGKFNRLLSWKDGRNYCRRMCMELVAIETRSKNDYIGKILAEDHAYGLVNSTWTSGRVCDFKGCNDDKDKSKDKDEKRPWFWASTSTWIPAKGHGYTGWAGKPRPQPDNAHPPEDCLAILPPETYHHASGKYAWHDIPCVYEYDVICEDDETLLKYARKKFKIVV